MNWRSRLILIMACLVALGHAGGSWAAAKVASAGANWATATWTPAGVPTASDTCTINSGVNLSVTTAAVCGSLALGNATGTSTTLTLAAGGSLNITTSGGQSGNLVLNPGNVGVTFTVAAATRTLTVDGTVTWSASTGTHVISVSTGQINFTRAAGITWPARGTLTVTGNNAGGSVNFTGLVTQTAGTIQNTTAGGTLNFNAGFTKSGGTFTTRSGETINFYGSLAVSGGTLTFNTASTENFMSAATITPTSTTTFGNLVINPGTGNTVTLAGNVTAAGDLTLSTGTFDLATFTAARTAGGGTLTIANGATMLVGASNYPTNYATDTLGPTSTVVYDRNDGTAQTVVTLAAPGYGNLTLSGSGTKTMPAAAIPVQGSFTMAGTASATAGGALTIGIDFVLGSGTTFNASTFNHSIAGNFTNNGGTFTASTGTITLNGGATQTIGGSTATTFNNLTVNNSAGITLSTVDPTIGATLTLSSGNITAGSRKVIIAAGGTVSRTSGHVIGNLQKNVALGATSRTYEIGDANAYAPVTVAFGSVTTAGNLIARSVSGEHPDIANSAIDAAQGVNRYWVLTNSGVVFTNYNANFTYAQSYPADLDSGVVAGDFVIGKADGCNVSLLSCTWTAPAISGTPSSTTATATGMTTLDSVNGTGFAIGNRKLNNFLVEAVGGGNIGPQIAGVAFNVRITARDASNNTLTNFTGTVDITSTCTLSAGGGTTPNFVLGVLTSRSVTISSTGTCSIIATRTSGTEAGTSNTFTVSATVSSFDACESTTPQCTAGGAPLFTKLVGTAFALDLIALDSGGSIATSFSGGSGTVSSIDLIAYTAANPANMTGAVNRCPVNAASATTNLGTSVAFTSGRKSALAVSSFSSAYRDVRVRITYSGTNYCSTDKFSVRPQALSIGVTDSLGGAFPATLAAGANFGLTASGGTGYDGTPASFTSSAAAQTVRTHVGATDYTGQLRQSGGNTIVFPAAASGVSNALIQYHDAGSFEVLAQKVIDNSFTGADVAGTDCVSGSASNTDNDSNANNGLLYGCNIANSAASGLFGRFFPNHYTLASSSLAGACGSSPNDFTYMGQSGLSAGYTLSAWSQANPTSLKLTQYTAGYSNLGTVSVVAADGNGVDLSSNLSPALTTTWFAGDYAVAVAARTYTRPASPSGPYDSLNIAVGITDADGAALSPLDFKLGDSNCASSCTHKKLGSASTKVRFGRVRLSNAFGSEKSDLAIPVQAHYWSGNSWVLNSVDGCTSLLSSAFFLLGAPVGTSASAVSLTGGVGTLTLTKPSPATTASVGVAANLGLSGSDQSCLSSHGGTAVAMPWLRSRNGNCAATYDRDPSARATFGIYAPETRKTVHVREQF